MRPTDVVRCHWCRERVLAMDSIVNVRTGVVSCRGCADDEVFFFEGVSK